MRSYTIKIPQGVREGQRIRLAGQGAPATVAGEKSGDLYLRVRLQKHPDFYFDHDDIYYDLHLPVWKAVLGGEVTLPTPEGRVKLKISPGTAAGKKLRIPGRGLPTPSGKRGDFYGVVQWNLPEELSPEEQQLWEKIRDLELSSDGEGQPFSS